MPTWENITNKKAIPKTRRNLVRNFLDRMLLAIASKANPENKLIPNMEKVNILTGFRNVPKNGKYENNLCNGKFLPNA
jgi:hypothetical protein